MSCICLKNYTGRFVTTVCNTVCEKFNLVLNPKVRVPLHKPFYACSSSLILSRRHYSLFSSFIYFTASCHVKIAMPESNSQENQPYKACVIVQIVAVPFLGV